MMNIEKHKAFWNGEGPCLILVPAAQMEPYDLEGYPERFHNPEKMWESEMRRAQPVVNWQTDGIPTVRPNLGTIFIPTIAGLGYKIQDGQMPWPGEPMKPEAIRSSRQVNLAETELMKLAEEFYHIHSSRGNGEIAAYHPDTQGVFDIAHLLYGNEIFYDLADEKKINWINELLDICLDLYVRVSLHVKALLKEDSTAMIHGHGTSQGVYFPHTGVRMSEDTVILISPSMIQRFISPLIERASEPFGGVFAHYCGQHKVFLEQLCQLDCVRAIDLGNPDMYDTRWLLERCAETHTVLYSGVAAEPTEDWEAYIRRIGNLVKETGARCILRPLVFPQTREECAAMRDLWHELTV